MCGGKYMTSKNNVIDFSNCKRAHVTYGGSDRKFGVIYNDEVYMLKFSENHAKRTDISTSYVNNAILELELKIKAVNKLKDAIDCFKVNYNSTGSAYAVEANDFMNESMKYKDIRDSLVSDNPKLFKQNFII